MANLSANLQLHPAPPIVDHFRELLVTTIDAHEGPDHDSHFCCSELYDEIVGALCQDAIVRTLRLIGFAEHWMPDQKVGRSIGAAMRLASEPLIVDALGRPFHALSKSP